MSKPYVVRHLELDGATTGRDSGSPDVHFELHPIGTELPEGEQRDELVIVIDDGGHRERRTRLDADAVRDLVAFLEEART